MIYKAHEINSKKQIKIARIILDIGISLSELRQSEDKWNKHKEVISADYINDNEKYRNRIKKMIDKAKKQDVDIVIFPACTFIYLTEKEFDFYRSVSEKIDWVLSGTLKINENGFKETGIILKKGKDFEEFNDGFVLGLNLGAISSRVALSSTIRKIRDDDIVNSEVSPVKENEENILAFDLGHHQYTGRYKMTLQSINRVLNKKSKYGSAIFLSYWKYLNGFSNYYWYENNDHIDIKVNRQKLKVKDSKKVDYFDIFEIDLEEGKNMNEPELIDDIDEVKDNMIRFKNSFEKGHNEITSKLSNFRKWYYYKKENIFAPSKFIGYKEMNANKYQQLSTKVMDGRNTEEILKKLSNDVSEVEEDKLLQKLQSWLDEYDKKVNKAATIRIIK